MYFPNDEYGEQGAEAESQVPEDLGRQIPEDLSEHHPSLKGIYFIKGTDFCSNMYVFVKDDEISLVDTGSWIAPDRISVQFEKLSLKIEKIARVAITHAHPDHVGGLAEVVQNSSAVVLIHANDAPSLESFGIKSISHLKDGDLVRLGQRNLRVLHTPGHTEGSVCLHDNELVVTGDTVFPGGSFGRTDFHSGDRRKLINSLDKLSRLDVRVMLPGHGDPLLSGASEQIGLAKNGAESIRQQ